MRLEAIAALLGHRSMEMTLTYARIADRVVADEYAAVSAQIDALYGQTTRLPADIETAAMTRLRREAHARMLGNGLCTRPVELDCRMESVCETCAYFAHRTRVRPRPPPPTRPRPRPPPTRPRRPLRHLLNQLEDTLLTTITRITPDRRQLDAAPVTASRRSVRGGGGRNHSGHAVPGVFHGRLCGPRFRLALTHGSHACRPMGGPRLRRR